MQHFHQIQNSHILAALSPTYSLLTLQAGLEVEEDEDILTAESLAVKYREQEDSNELHKLKEERRRSGNRRSRDSGTWDNWAKYGIAALAVGVGLFYSMIRH